MKGPVPILTLTGTTKVMSRPYETQSMKERFQIALRRWKDFFILIIAAAIVGAVIGTIGAAFAFTLDKVTAFRLQNSWLLFGLPFAGFIIIALYKWLLHGKKDGGTNIVLSAIHSNDEIPLAMAPLIFISTAITHLVGGSAGREGAALQLGGSIGNAFARLVKADRQQKSTLIMCGMSAAFSALFGTPMAAALFPIEVVSVGIMHYNALLPNVVAALVARGIAAQFGLEPELFNLGEFAPFGVESGVRISILAILCGVGSIIFVLALHYGKHFARFIKNEYLRLFVGGSIVLVLSLIEGHQTYNGAGMQIVELAFEDPMKGWVFLLKILFTALTLSVGYRGGEIVPTLFIGATLGSALSTVVGLPVGLCAAVGMVSLFCSATNCPLTSLLIAFELFGYEAMPYYLLAVSISFLASGYHGLYSSQRIVYSKYKSTYINRQVSEEYK